MRTKHAGKTRVSLWGQSVKSGMLQSKMIEQLRVGMTIFRISTLISNVENDEPGSNRFSYLVFSRCFIWTSIISSGVVVIVDWPEVVTSSQISSSLPFRLARMRVMNCLIQLS